VFHLGKDFFLCYYFEFTVIMVAVTDTVILQILSCFLFILWMVATVVAGPNTRQPSLADAILA